MNKMYRNIIILRNIITMSSSSFKGLTRFFKEKYSCEDKKNAINYLCSTVWNRDGTIRYENPSKEPAAYQGIQIFETPIENKHIDTECNHFIGYSIQGLRSETNDDMNLSGGTFFTTSIDGYNWSRQSYSASWNEKHSHFDCKLTDLDDKSNYSFTLSMNNPKSLNWVGYETNAISINPNNLADGDAGFSAAGYFIASPEDSPKNYTSYETVYETAGWGSTSTTESKYFDSILRTKALVLTELEPGKVESTNVASRMMNIKAEKTINVSGLQNIFMEVNYNNKLHYSVVLVKYDKPLSVSKTNNTQSGNCVFFYYDGLTNSLQPIQGTYLCRYSIQGTTSKTVINITCGDPNNPIIQLKTTSLSTDSEIQVIIKRCNVGIVLKEDRNAKKLVELSDEAARIIRLPGVDIERVESVLEYKSKPYTLSNDVLTIGDSVLSMPLNATGSYINNQSWVNIIYQVLNGDRTYNGPRWVTGI